MAKLSDTRIRGIKPRAKRFKLFDGEGLFLIVTPQGGRWWQQGYRWAGKEQSLSVGTYLGHTKLESTVRHLGIEVNDALEMAEQTEV